MNHKTVVPKLRFPGFEGEWELKKVGQLCDSIVPGRNKPTNFDGDIPWITTPDIEHNGIISYSKKGLNISRNEAKKVGSKIVPINSIIISCVGELGLSAIAGKEIIINQQLHAFIPKEKIEYRFLLYQLNLKKKYMDKVATKTAVPYMNKDNCNSIPIDFPTLPEQQKIASFLSAVDEKIQQLSRKKELLSQYKKGVMQQLFSGKLRFKDENGEDYADWEEKKLGEVCEIAKSGGTPTSTNREYYNGDIPFLSISDMTSQGKYLNYTTNHISKLGLDNSSSWIVPANSIIYSMYASVGFVAINKIPLATSQAVLNLILKKGISTDFMYYKLVDFQKEIAQFITTGTQGNLNAQSVKNFKIELPSLQEQQKIANFLSSIDVKIESTNQQINQTQSFKKGLLQQMFV